MWDAGRPLRRQTSREWNAVSSLAKGGLSISCVVADKGYDAEYVHRDIHERLGADAMIPIRNIEPARIEYSSWEGLIIN